MVACADSVPAATTAADTTAAASNSGSTTTATTEPATSSGPAMRDDTGTAGASSTSETGGLPVDVGKGEVRFVALGDAGEGNETQALVGQTIATVCEERGCDFALYLGDNFYDVGVDSTMDEQFDLKFEVPYAAVDFPFYITLGNHDYGILGNEFGKSQYYLEYSTLSAKWTLPSEFYSFQQEHVHFISLNTAQLFWDHETDAQRQFLAGDLATVQDNWIIAFGHHPYISNGKHGNAGHYEGFGGIIGGETIKTFFDEEICGRVHVYICGHDHDRQWLVSQCGTEFLVSGGGAKLTDLINRDDNPTHWGDDTVEGFLWVEIIDDSFTGVFYDKDGNPEYERTITL